MARSKKKTVVRYDYIMLFYKNAKVLQEQARDNLIELYMGMPEDLGLRAMMTKFKIKLNHSKFRNKNLKLLHRFVFEDDHENLEFFLSLNPYVSKNITPPSFSSKKTFYLFLELLRLNEIDFKIDIYNEAAVSNFFASAPFVVKEAKNSPTELLLSFLTLPSGLNEVNLKTYANISSKIDVDIVEELFPMMGFFLRGKENVHKEYDSFADVMFLQKLFEDPQILRKSVPDFLQEIFGFKSANLIKLFLSSKNRSYLCFLGAIFKEAFVARNKTDFANYFLNKELVYKSNEKIVYFFEEIVLMSMILSPEQFKKIFTEIYEGDPSSIDDYLVLAENIAFFMDSNLQIETKFSNINTFSKFCRYIEARTTKSRYAEVDLPQNLPINGRRIGENIQLFLPKTNHELIDWGAELKNCLSDVEYSESVYDERCTIVGVKEFGVLKYCLEISYGVIHQAKGVRNSPMPKEMLRVIKKDLSPILKSMKKTFS